MRSDLIKMYNFYTTEDPRIEAKRDEPQNERSLQFMKLVKYHLAFIKIA